MGRIFSTLFELLNYRERRSFWILLGVILFEALLEILSVSMIPVYVGLIAYQDSFTDLWGWGGSLQSITAGLSHYSLIIRASVALALFFLFKLFMTIFSTYWRARYAQNRAIKLSCRLYRAYMEAPYIFHIENNSAELIRNINTDCMQLAEKVLMPLLNLLSSLIIFTSIFLLLMWRVPFSTLLLLAAFLALAALIVLRQKKIIQTLGQEAQHRRGQVLKALIEGLHSIKEIRLLQRTDYFIRLFSSEFARLMQIQRYIQILNTFIPNLVEVLTIISLLAITLLLLSIEATPEAILPVIALYTVALARMKSTLSGMMHSYTQVQHNQASLRVIYNSLQQLKIKNTNRLLHLPEKRGFQKSIELHSVSYRYPKTETYSLQDISLSIKKGEAIGFVGHTGAGKSTLADLIMGVLEPTKGSISFDGSIIQDNLSKWQRKIGYVPQVLYLLDGTIHQNIALGLTPDEIDEQSIKRVVRDACLEDVIGPLPKGLNTIIGESGIKLSGGQRQRIAIARAIYTYPEVLVLDEGTSALDTATEREVMKAIEGMKGQRTILLIAHRLSTVANCDRIVFLHNGRIDAIGSYSELIATHDGFRRLAQIH
jgi:ABC-type multidrug transport system fused ATPase/permease subunit